MKDCFCYRYKCRLVAKGFTQRAWIEYVYTFAPATRLDQIRFLIAYATKVGAYLFSADVRGAYLESCLEEEIYLWLNPDPRYPLQQQTKTLVRLKKGLYGLKQSGHNWHQLNSRVLQSAGLKQSDIDPCLYFTPRNEGKPWGIILVHVDDYLVITDSPQWWERIHKFCNTLIELDNLGEIGTGVKAQSFAGLRIDYNRDTGCTKIDQIAHVIKMLSDYMCDSTIKTTPCTQNLTLRRRNCKICENDNPTDPNVDIKWFRSVIGSLIWLVGGTHPDCAYTLGQIAKWSHNVQLHNIGHLKHLLKYGIGTFN